MMEEMPPSCADLSFSAATDPIAGMEKTDNIKETMVTAVATAMMNRKTGANVRHNKSLC